MRARDMHAYKMHAHEMHAHEMHAHKTHAHGTHACEICAHEMHKLGRCREIFDLSPVSLCLAVSVTLLAQFSGRQERHRSLGCDDYQGVQCIMAAIH